MEELVESKPSKDRSPVFPFITLEQALERARTVFAEERRGAFPYLRLVRHWGFTEKSSGALQTVAALKQYQLLNELGGSALTRQFQLSDLAVRILLDTRPLSEEREQLVRKAAMSPAVAAEVYSKWEGELPKEGTINHYLVLERRFLESNAPKVTKILQENHRFAKVAFENHQTNKSGGDMIANQTENDELEESNVHPLVQIPNRGNIPATSVSVPSGDEVETIRLPNGTRVTLAFTSQPDLATYRQLASFLKWKVQAFGEPATGVNSGDDQAG